MPQSSKSSHPYVGLPDRQFWKRMGGDPGTGLFDPVSEVKFRIRQDEKIVTAGSCFAQHVARYLTNKGFNHHITENAHPLVPPRVATAHNYGMFAARYGNIYTARQLVQLLDRAYGRFEPIEGAWRSTDGKSLVDPFRPQIQPGGYRDLNDLEADRRQHLAAVRQAVEEMDVFVFTLGLTEAWTDKRDGSVYPLAPGVAGGAFDPEKHAFRNFDEVETTADLTTAFEFIREINPRVRFIVTVSPVPLNATFEERNCWVSTTYSKAVLRIAAEKVCNSFEACQYFLSYEIITSPKIRARYYAPDGREVLEKGVRHVMQILARHFFEDAPDARGQGAGPAAVKTQPDAAQSHLETMEDLIEVLCDEAAIDNE